ncbi:MAG: hypothetical protein IKN63_06475 [Bacilli bacterium]|nr:hypothetical protein [Bacilli bacterium]
MKILCIGNTSYDITIPVEEFPIENKKIRLKDKLVECGGGSASTGAILLSKWNIDTFIASTIGNDFYGEQIKKEYLEAGVNTKFLQTKDIKTTTSFIITNVTSGTRTILTSKDENLTYDRNIDLDFDYILVDGEHMETAYDTIIKRPSSKVLIDAGRVNDNILKLCTVSDYIVCSNDFAKDYTNIDFEYSDYDTLKIVYDQIQKDFKGIVIITLESYGSMIKINNEYKIIPSIKVKAIDSTGAGDIYHASLLYFISQGMEITSAMRYANITGAISTTRLGGRNSIPSLEEVLAYVK